MTSMNCEQYERLLSAYECGDADAEMLGEMAEHERTCPHCAALRKSSDEILAGLKEMREEVPEMPDDFHRKWTDAIRPRKKSLPMRIARIAGVVAACLILLIGAVNIRDELSWKLRKQSYSMDAGAGGAAYEMAVDSYAAPMMSTANSSRALGASMMAEESAAYEMDDSEEAYEAAGETGVTDDRKIIRTATVDVTTNEFDASFEALKTLCADNGGWTSQSSVNTMSSGLKQAFLTMRIPSRNLDTFLSGTAGIGRITSQNETAEDVTENYRDTKTRLKTQQMLLERLQNLVTTTKKLEDLLALEDQIADKQYQIDMLTSSLQRTDKAVDYSQVSITLREEKKKEVVETRTISFGERVMAAFQIGIESFMDFLADTLLFLIAALPYLICLLLIAGIAILVVRRIRRHRGR